MMTKIIVEELKPVSKYFAIDSAIRNPKNKPNNP